MAVRIRWVKNLPVILVRSQRCVFQNMAALNLGHIIFIKPRAWDNEPLIQHELRHTKQVLDRVYIGWVVSWVMSHNFRLWTEVDAYRVQLSYIPEGPGRDVARAVFARSLANNYKGYSVYRFFPIRVTEEKAYELLLLPAEE